MRYTPFKKEKKKKKGKEKKGEKKGKNRRSTLLNLLIYFEI